MRQHKSRTLECEPDHQLGTGLKEFDCGFKGHILLSSDVWM